jgi:hypothetical protein
MSHWGSQLLLNFVVAGAVVGSLATLVQQHKSGLAGFLYGVVPFTFLYLYVHTWLTGHDVPVFAWNAAVGGVFWLLFVMLVGYLAFHGRWSNGAALLGGSLLTGMLLASYWKLHGPAGS